jgi:hypothetical protein
LNFCIFFSMPGAWASGWSGLDYFAAILDS